MSRYRQQALRRPPSQSWRTSLRDHASSIWAADLFTVQTLTFRTLYVFVVIDHGRRRIRHWNVTEHGRCLDGRGLIGHPLRGDAALEPGQRLAVGVLGAWREALDPAAGEIEGDQLREGGGGAHVESPAPRGGTR